MMRAWIGIAALAGSWLFGTTYYYAPNGMVWWALIAVGTLLLSGSLPALPDRKQMAVGLALFLPAAFIGDWPYRAAPLAVALGLALNLIPFSRAWVLRLASGVFSAGIVLTAQAAALFGYSALTSRSHELPAPLMAILQVLLKACGVDAAVDGATIALSSTRQTHRMAAVWELWIDPTTWCFLVGGVAFLAISAWARCEKKRLAAWASAAGLLAAIVMLWTPIRACLLVAIYLHRDLMSDPAAGPSPLMNHFLSAWVHLALVTVPAVLAWRWARLAETSAEPAAEPTAQPVQPVRRELLAAGLLAIGAAAMALATFWEPVNRPDAWSWEPGARRKAGRVTVVERHSKWEPTDRPYDTTRFGESSGYNYAAIYDYCSRFYDMGRLLETDSIDDRTLGQCDVLVVKVPTEPWESREIDAVARFVERGGGLLMIGDHTNFEKSGSYLNGIAARFGFRYRYDLLFGTEDAYEERYDRPVFVHPVVQHVPGFDFAVSCSIDPARSWGESGIRGAGLWSLMADYNFSNYHPYPFHRPEMHYGAFVQLWTVRRGQGRVAAFTDSTIFSNFATFEPGKADLMLNMLEWLNHRNNLGDLRGWLFWLGFVPVAAGLVLARRKRGAWLVLLAAGVSGFHGGAVAATAMNRSAMPLPAQKRSFTRVAVDRTVSEVPLAQGGFIRGDGKGYGMFEEWIARLGYFPDRRTGDAAFEANAMVVLCPTRSVSDDFQSKVVEFVKGGGRLFVVDSPENSSSTADRLLEPFGLSMRREKAQRGSLSVDKQDAKVPVVEAWEVRGGKPVARLDSGRPIAAIAEFGKGSVLAIGFGSTFNDDAMGGTWTVDPTAEQRARYDAYFSLWRLLVEGREAPSKR